QYAGHNPRLWCFQTTFPQRCNSVLMRSNFFAVLSNVILQLENWRIGDNFQRTVKKFAYRFLALFTRLRPNRRKKKIVSCWQFFSCVSLGGGPFQNPVDG